jgi:hypothetical protein
MREGEELTLESAIVTPKRRMKPFIRATNVGDVIRSAIRKAGFEWRPYVLRSYFDTQLMLAESKGLVLRDYRGFWMGHKGDIENRYTTNKARLPETVIDDMREAYRRSQKFLQTTAGSLGEDALRESFRKQLLLVAGFSPEEVEALDPSMDDETFQETVRKKLLGSMANNGASQKVARARLMHALQHKAPQFRHLHRESESAPQTPHELFDTFESKRARRTSQSGPKKND